jgi:hypothetical protein
MPVQSFTLAEIMPQLLSRLITFTHDKYNETFGLSGMAVENAPQLDPKIRIMGKVYNRPVASDIPEASEAQLIKDTKFTDEMFTAPEYGQGFAITANDILLNNNYIVNFSSTIEKGRAPMLFERVNNASIMPIEMIKRVEDSQVKQIIDTGTLTFDNYTTIDFERDASNSNVITTANLKWTIANAATMTPFKNIDDWTTQVADRGNSGSAEFIVLMGRNAFKAYVNSDDYKDDSNQRRNFKVERVLNGGVNDTMNINIPKGAVYRESILKNTVGVAHIFTYNQTFTNNDGDSEQWLDDDKVYVIADDNVFQRQPVEVMTLDLIAKSAMMRSVMNAMPKMRGWLVTPEWNKTTTRALVMGIYRKFLTLPLTINKTFTATVN